MAGAATSQLWSAQACLNELRAIDRERQQAVLEMGRELDALVGELRGSFVGTCRQQQIAGALEAMRDRLEAMA